MDKKVLIFGVGGFVGPYLYKEFKCNGYKVFGSDIIKSDRNDEKMDFCEVDILNAEAVAKTIKEIKPDIIINLAAISSVGVSWNQPQTTIMVNVLGTLNVLEGARRIEPPPKVLLIGSSEEYMESDSPINENMLLNANNPYGISKITQERFMMLYYERYGMDILYTRSFNHTGIGQRDSFVLADFCKQVANINRTGRPGRIKVGNLTVARDFSHVEDVARAYRLISESNKAHRVYNVGSGIAYKISDLLNYIISLGNVEIEVQIDPSRHRPIDIPTICCDNRRLKHELGWCPQKTVLDALKEQYDNYLKT